MGDVHTRFLYEFIKNSQNIHVFIWPLGYRYILFHFWLNDSIISVKKTILLWQKTSSPPNYTVFAFLPERLIGTRTETKEVGVLSNLLIRRNDALYLICKRRRLRPILDLMTRHF